MLFLGGVLTLGILEEGIGLAETCGGGGVEGGGGIVWTCGGGGVKGGGGIVKDGIFGVGRGFE